MLNKLCKILFFINLLLVIVQSDASPPPLPPSLPAAEVDTKDKDVRSSADISFFDKFKQFFSKPKKKDIPPKQANEQTKAAHQEEPKLASQEPNDNEQAEPFIDVGNTALPSATRDNVHTNPSHESSVNLASHDIQESNEAEASEPFIDIGSATLPSVTSNEMHEAQVASNEHNDTNLASNIIIPNVPRPIVSMPPAQAGSYVVPPQRPVQIYKPTNLPPVHKPIPLNSSPDANKEEESVAPIAPPSITNIPAVSPPVVSPPVTQDTTSSTMPTVPPAVPSNVPAPSVMPTNQPSTQPITPTSPNTPVTTPSKVIPTTDSSAELNNSQETFVAVSDVSKKQDWNTPLIPVVVVKLNQLQPLQINNNQTTNNQEKSPPVSSPNVTIQKQDNNVNNETSELVTKFVKDETQMLLLPDDDIVLGKLTEQATLEQMDMYAYIELFQKKEAWIASAERRKVVESFIKYDNDINKKKDIYANLSYGSAVENAFRAVDRNNLLELRALLDVYPILQEKGRSGETLLTAAIYNDNYYLAKFLVIRGIKISTLNDECQYPLDIALAQGSANIACMLIKAKGY
ncbi:ankyrin repeat domain-containing protein [Rickettsia sp. Tenjiku01]|uniref:ankyrin repeat domain-containing protein n=1 Tax=Rickettsia sp. Tenjiku01 TaxID=1736693 RepID=UPI0007DB2E39|nr:ankyrin repeat domain-containing protein [Rickettsia sp. Tenjiku01]